MRQVPTSVDPEDPRSRLDAERLVVELPIARLATTLAPLRGPRTDPASPLAPLPLRVAATGAGTYEVLDGFKRLARWIRDGRTHVPVVVEDAAGVACKARLLETNAPRRTLSPMDEARVVRALADDDHLAVAQIATLLGRSRGWVERRLTLGRRLAPDVAAHVDAGRLSATTAGGLAMLPRADQKRLADTIERHGLRTREAEAFLAAWRAVADTPTREALVRDPRSAVPAPRAAPVSPLGPTAHELQRRFDQTERALSELVALDLTGFPDTERRVLEASQRRLAAQIVRLARTVQEEAPHADARGESRTRSARPGTHPDPGDGAATRARRQDHPPGAGPAATAARAVQARGVPDVDHGPLRTGAALPADLARAPRPGLHGWRDDPEGLPSDAGPAPPAAARPPPAHDDADPDPSACARITGRALRRRGDAPGAPGRDHLPELQCARR
jgi:ParB-like chromosome segregation protein Spo0J